MLRRAIWGVLVLLLLLWPVAASAQTETPTLTPTHTPTPEPVSIWTLSPEVNPDGTPGPVQVAEFRYSSDPGDVLTTMLLLAILVSLWTFFLIAVLLIRMHK